MPYHIHTYQDYLTNTPNDHITFEACGTLLDQIIAAMDLSDPLYQETWDAFMAAVIPYTKIRADFAFLPLADSAEQGSRRTAAHDSVIIQLTALARLMAQDGRDVTWAEALNISLSDLNRAKAKLNRRKIGDFANYLTYVNALSSRLV